VYDGTPQDCWSCHRSDYEGVPAPNHIVGAFSQNCLECHSDVAWKPSLFDHGRTDFPLTGAHLAAECASCHANGVFEGTSQDCWTCHQLDYQQAVDPNHIAAAFSQDCIECHTASAWKPSTFDHGETDFPLTGAHVSAECASCHANGVFDGTPQDCWTCHQLDYKQVVDPNHIAAAFSQDCMECHTEAAWKPSTFDHGKTDFPLTGAHVTAECASCHANGVFDGTPQDCWTCHQLDYQQVVDPNHIVAAFSQDCLECHTEAAWKPSTFDHGKTDFPLMGAHVTAECASCHANGVFDGTRQDCWTCHQLDYEQVVSPNHIAAVFSQDCLECHTDAVWKPSTFDHGKTDFPLTGAHVTAECASCHANGVFDGTPQDCWTCHQLDYEQAVDPNHIAAAFSQDCLECHTDAVWRPSTFDHGKTDFPLTGAHVSAECASCHANGVFDGTPQDCWTCHQLDYEQVVDPNHVVAAFFHDCIECHTDVAWKPSAFDHAATQFPLTGRHQQVDCVDCHSNGYDETATECFACHQADYERTRDPNHVVSLFPTDCTPCHTPNRWEPSTFDHRSYFPIYSGEHRGEWGSCSDCHTQPSDFTVFSCVTCHEHRKSKMDSEHDDERGYVYLSQECYRCHPDGKD
jgi:hypothetical protein